jgi:hypothetical protein
LSERPSNTTFLFSNTALLRGKAITLWNQIRTARLKLLKAGIYGDDIPKALGSSQAAALCMNNVLSSINTTIRTDASAFANDFVTNLAKGESVRSKNCGPPAIAV